MGSIINIILPFYLSVNSGGNYSGYEVFALENVSVSIEAKSFDNSNRVGKQYGNPNFELPSNELVQSENTRYSGGADFFNYTSTKLVEKYRNGKETATILCSISDYYDYDDRANKVISIDNSTGKMSFKMYDQVIPMVYGADGKDRPMSLYQDGTPKVFQVLGSKIYYDGAVWQELSLQEVDKNEINWYNYYGEK